MENRDRDKLSRNSGSTSAGDVNRDVPSRRGQEENTNADFGQKIGQSEKGEPGSRQSGSVGSSGMRGSKKDSDLESDIESDRSSSDESSSEH